MAAQLAAEHDEVEFVGTPDGLEARLVPAAGVAFTPLPAAGFDRSRPLTLVTSSLKIARSTMRAYRRMGADRPDVIIGFGGFVSIPVGLAAALRRIPLVLHEQNSVPGLANKLLSRFAAAAAVTYEESAAALGKADRVVVTGNPVRQSVLEASREKGRDALGLSESDVLLLVFGGSRGARHLNQAIAALMPEILQVDGVVVLHITGPGEYDSVREQHDAVDEPLAARWRIEPYVDGMGDVLAAADLLVTRAGATSLAELTCLGKPAVLVPYPYATDDHQTKNARTLVAHGAARVVADDELDGSRFGDEVLELLKDAQARATMSAASRALGRPDAAQRVVDLVRQAVGDAAG